jgi:hypothetical protein
VKGGISADFGEDFWKGREICDGWAKSLAPSEERVGVAIAKCGCDQLSGEI